MLLEVADQFFRVITGGLNNLDAAVHNGVRVLPVRGRLDGGQYREVDAERLIGHRLASLDFPSQMLRRRLCQRGDDSEGAGVGHGGRQLRTSNPLHAALDDRIAYSQLLGDARSDHGIHEAAGSLNDP